jgi:hypothetical protein
VPNDHGWSQGVDDMLIVGMQQQTVIDVPLVKTSIPEKPITALIYTYFCI